MVDPNTFGTDEFVEWCRRVGCMPYICTNAGNGTPEAMRDWVAYCNATEGKYAELRRSGGHKSPLIEEAGHRGRIKIAFDEWNLRGWHHPGKPVSCVVRLKDALLEGAYEAMVLAGDSPDAFNSVEHPERVKPERKRLTVKQGAIRLPPHSLTVVKAAVSASRKTRSP